MELFGVIWDMDGVLVDTGEFHYRTWQDTLAYYGIPFSIEDFRATFGMNNRGTLAALLGELVDEDLVAEISEKKETQFRAMVRGKASLLPGVFAWLQRFQEMQHPQVIASSAPPANIDVLIDALGIRSYFKEIVAGSDLPAKPEPDVFLRAAGALHLPASQCLVIEDSIAGVSGAKRAGMKCVAVTNTYPASQLQAADLVVSSLEELRPSAMDALFTAS